MDKLERLKEDLLAKIDILDKDVYNNDWCKGKIEGFREVLSSMDSIQEDPVSIWHDGCEIPESGANILMIRKDEEDSNYPPIAGCFHGTNSRLDGRNWGYYNGFCYNEIKPPVKWAYIDDILNLSNVERTGKNRKEEPVSEELCDAANDYGLNIRKGYPRVMDETDKYIYNAFKAGAQWQKNQMIKNAIKCEITWMDGFILNYTQEQQDDLLEKIGAEVGDKVKLVIIKED